MSRFSRRWADRLIGGGATFLVEIAVVVCAVTAAWLVAVVVLKVF
jgi:hypothetical protein